MQTSFDADDTGIAQALRANKDVVNMLSSPGSGWMTWGFHGQQWKAKEFFVYMMDEVAVKFKEEKYGNGAAIAKKLGNVQAMERVLKIMAQMPEFNSAVWDHDPYLVGVERGCVDIRKLVWREQRPDDFVSMNIPVKYDEKAKCPRFEQFVKEIMPDEDMAWYLQKLIGSGLVAVSPQQLFHFWYGQGANGKSVLQGVVQRVLGALSGTVPTSIFIRGSDESANRFALARNLYCRTIFAPEVPGGKALEEYRLKQLTGEDSVVVEEKGKPQYEGRFVATINMLVNEIPTISDNSEAMRRRLRVVPFDQTFNDKRDDALMGKLMTEKEGILAWMFRGANGYFHEGLVCEKIQEATDEATRKSFSMHDFLEMMLEKGTEEDRVAFRDIEERYTAYQLKRGLHNNLTNKTMGQAIMAFCGKESRQGGSGGVATTYRGWKFRADVEAVEWRPQ